MKVARDISLNFLDVVKNKTWKRVNFLVLKMCQSVQIQTEFRGKKDAVSTIECITQVERQLRVH